jgi:beta-galactosidase
MYQYHAVIVILAIALQAQAALSPSRQNISMDGTWRIEEGSMSNVPAAFEHRVPVPGLVTLADPPFVKPGPKVAKREQIPQKDPRRDAFWYQRRFTMKGPIPEIARLKVSKAMFGTSVFLNGTPLGDHLPSFTPGYFDARPALKVGENEILIRVGADRDAVGCGVPNGFDFEKERYIPGIFDSVQLILSESPFIENVQVAPDISNGLARVLIEMSASGQVDVNVREAKSGTPVSSQFFQRAATQIEAVMRMPKCHPWSPEDPFLYTVTVRTAGDELTTRFGMREIRFDPATRRAMLNGKPYFLRGTNFTLYRFFEDSECGDLPWNDAWVRKLHQRLKEMHWNCVRYCIGFPPERWYEIADEEGVLVDDEFPIWFGGDVPAPLTVEELAREYGEWMQERWNHPCVFLWDACNETKSPKTGAAIKQVRGFDLSSRPWDDGYSKPQEPGDTIESHPYHFFRGFRLSKLATASQIPNFSDGVHPVVVNEYGWHWVNRDGSPTTLTRDIYRDVLGEQATPAQRFHMQATWLAADTEFWRAHRQASAVMHFTTLGYSRPDGQTCDHWTQGGVARLEWEPEFHQYVRDAFAPVGLMVDYWNEHPRAGSAVRVPVILVNDLEKPWAGSVTLRVRAGGGALHKIRKGARIEPFGTTNVVFDMQWPEATGACILEAELPGADGQPVRSIREVTVREARQSTLIEHSALTASSVYQPEYQAENAADGNEETYWSSAFQDDAWLAADLGALKRISRVNILWETAYAKAFSVQISADGKSWVEVYGTKDGTGGLSEIKFAPLDARHVRVVCTQRATQWGHAIRELDVLP